MSLALRSNDLICVAVVLIILLYDFTHGQVAEEGHWGYDSNDGPNEWCNLFPSAHCCGHRQSPIAIVRRDAEIMNDTLEFHNFKSLPTHAKLLNNGHSAIVQMIGMEKTPYVRLSSHVSRFMLNQFHFHWGTTSIKGSEHTIDGIRYPLEMHIVLINSRHKSLAEAREFFNGVVVVGFLFKVSDQDNENYDPLIKTLSVVKPEGGQTNVKRRFPLISLLPKQLGGMFAYKGSLTTPPCSESVTWFINESQMFISDRQIAQFRKLQAETNPMNLENSTSLLDRNFRPLQPMNNRSIFYLKGKFAI